MLVSSPSFSHRFLDDLIIPSQTRIYIGPLDDNVIGTDLTEQFKQYGEIIVISKAYITQNVFSLNFLSLPVFFCLTQGVSRLKGNETTSKKSYGLMDFKDTIAMRKAFGAKIFVKGKHVKIALSRFGMEVALSPTVVFFYEV